MWCLRKILCLLLNHSHALDCFALVMARGLGRTRDEPYRRWTLADADTITIIGARATVCSKHSFAQLRPYSHHPRTSCGTPLFVVSFLSLHSAVVTHNLSQNCNFTQVWLAWGLSVSPPDGVAALLWRGLAARGIRENVHVDLLSFFDPILQWFCFYNFAEPVIEAFDTDRNTRTSIISPKHFILFSLSYSYVLSSTSPPGTPFFYSNFC